MTTNEARSSNCFFSLYSKRIISGVSTVKRALPEVTTASGLATGLASCATEDRAKATPHAVASNVFIFIPVFKFLWFVFFKRIMLVKALSSFFMYICFLTREGIVETRHALSHCHTAEPADMPIPGDGMRMEAERRQGMPCLYMSTSSAISKAPFRGLGVNRTLPGRSWWGRSPSGCPGRHWGWSQTRRCLCTSCAAVPPWGCCARGR